jgi:hypothetical protein
VADRVRITDEGWDRLPRIAIARACRMVWRGIPLVGPGVWQELVNRVLAQGRNFSLGVQTNPFAMRQNARGVLKEIGTLPKVGSPAAIMVCSAAGQLAEGLNLAAEALVIAEDQAAISEVSERMASTSDRALTARRLASDGVLVAITNQNDKDKVEAALRTEEVALQRYRAREIERLRQPEEYDAAGIGPSFDPSPTGPLGALWPTGEPSWYRTEAVSTPVVALAADFQDRQNAEVVTFYDPDDEVQVFLSKALAFTADVLKLAQGGKIPPTPCVYVPHKFIGHDHALVVGQLVSAGAVALDDGDLNVPEPPHSPEDFAHAVELLHRSIGRSSFRPFGNDMAGFAPTNLPPLPPLSDKQWTRVSSTAASYDSVVQRSSGETTGGWPTAD